MKKSIISLITVFWAVNIVAQTATAPSSGITELTANTPSQKLY